MKLLAFGLQWRQSAIQKLMNEHLEEPKLNFNLIPTCDEHDVGQYDFRISIDATDKHSQRRGVLYSEETQRLYVKTNENVYIDCTYKVKMPIQPLHVRVFAVYSTDTGEPVLRCQNHISKDTETDEIIRKSLVRCMNPKATYHGSDAGKTINDRYSVLVPLTAATKATDANYMKQQLIINFTCNNSCMNRKPTLALFLLEGSNGEILAQRVLKVKICTCPKRDKRLYEGSAGHFNKRRALADPEFCGSSPKTPRYDETIVKDEVSRNSFEDNSDADSSRHEHTDGGVSGGGGGGGPDNCGTADIKRDKNTGDFVLTLKYKTQAQVQEVLRVLYSNAITNEVFFDAHAKGKKSRESEAFKRAHEKVSRLK